MNEWMLNAVNGSSRVLAGESLDNLPAYLPDARCVLITDPEVRRLHGRRFPDFDIIEIGRGENIKTLDSLVHVYREFLRMGLDRSSFIVGIGGGIVCDIAGFAAATYMRGMEFGAVPTTLLAQADAGLGGKTGVNFQGRKNLIGVFRQPRFVLCDAEVLMTLPEQEVRCGLAEIVKHGAIRSSELFDFLERNRAALLARKPETLERVVADSLRIKSFVVEADPFERGERRELNFGHTLGHALESVLGLRHGEAVAAGMAAAGRISHRKNHLAAGDLDRLKNLLEGFGLSTNFASPAEAEILSRAVRADKKRRGDTVDFVLLSGIGRAVVAGMSFAELEGYIHDLCKRG